MRLDGTAQLVVEQPDVEMKIKGSEKSIPAKGMKRTELSVALRVPAAERQAVMSELQQLLRGVFSFDSFDACPIVPDESMDWRFSLSLNYRGMRDVIVVKDRNVLLEADARAWEQFTKAGQEAERREREKTEEWTPEFLVSLGFLKCRGSNTPIEVEEGEPYDVLNLPIRTLACKIECRIQARRLA